MRPLRIESGLALEEWSKRTILCNYTGIEQLNREAGETEGSGRICRIVISVSK